MEWSERMNAAVAYVEAHLAEQMDVKAAAQLAGCSEYEFRRVFSSVAQIPLSAYIRNRRMTLAVEDIQRGESILDIALRYGYCSQAAFTRAFRQFHGVSPSQARMAGMQLRVFPRMVFKPAHRPQRNEKGRGSIIGAGERGVAVTVEQDCSAIHQTNIAFWNEAGGELLGDIHLPRYGAFVSEERCGLLGDVRGKAVLEIGCGNGESLVYMGKRGAGELWGLDISDRQIERAASRLTKEGIQARLICEPMEAACSIPRGYFDLVYSVYGIGWTTNLDETLHRIASCLKRGGVLVFSWSHPIHKCVAVQDGELLFKKNYFDESWYTVALDGAVLSLADRKLSTYINALAENGFVIEKLVEQSDDERLGSEQGGFAAKARMLPATFVIKARKQ